MDGWKRWSVFVGATECLRSSQVHAGAIELQSKTDWPAHWGFRECRQHRGNPYYWRPNSNYDQLRVITDFVERLRMFECVCLDLSAPKDAMQASHTNAHAHTSTTLPISLARLIFRAQSRACWQGDNHHERAPRAWSGTRGSSFPRCSLPRSSPVARSLCLSPREA